MSSLFFSTEGLLDLAVDLPLDTTTWKTNTPYLFNTPPRECVIEYLKGEARRKVREDGSEVTNIMPTAYGRISKTTDIHGEDLDIYINQDDYHPDAQVYILDQVGLTGLFDEHKVFFGFPTVDAVQNIYLSVIKPGIAPVKIGAITSMNQAQFAEWIAQTDKTMSPASFDTELGTIVVSKCQIFTKASATPTVGKPKASQTPGGTEITLPALPSGPVIVTKANGENGLHHICHIYGPVDYAQWYGFNDKIVRLLDTATPADKFTFLISSGGGSVPTVGPLLAAMDSTLAETVSVAEGPVASAAVFIWAWGKTRVIKDNAYFMQHATFQIAIGKTQYIQALTAFADSYSRQLIDRLSDIGMFTDDEVNNMLNTGADVFITGADMIARVGAISGEGAANND